MASVSRSSMAAPRASPCLMASPNALSPPPPSRFPSARPPLVNSEFPKSKICNFWYRRTRIFCIKRSHSHLRDSFGALSKATTLNFSTLGLRCDYERFGCNAVGGEPRNVLRVKNGSRFVMSASLEEIKSGELTLDESLKLVDEFLEKEEDSKALEIVRLLQKRPDGLKGFGNASQALVFLSFFPLQKISNFVFKKYIGSIHNICFLQIPPRDYTVEDLRLNKIDTKQFLAPEDGTIKTIKRGFQILLISGLIFAWKEFDLDQLQILFLVISFLFLGTVDQIVNAGGMEFLILDTAANKLSKQYNERVVQHEAGHFLIAYLLGFLPKVYTLSSLDAFLRFGTLKVQAGTTFVDYEYQNEVAGGKISSATLNKITCIGLAGVIIEYIKFGKAQGGLTDIQQLDSLFRSLNFSQKKTDGQIRYSVLNTVLILRRHQKAHSALVRAMNQNASIGECVLAIEKELAYDI